VRRLLHIFTFLLVAMFVVSSCAGRSANPVMVQQYGDRELSCEGLEMQMSMIDQEIRRKIPDTHKTGKNVALGVAGWFLLVPWFFMDFSKAEQIEIDALRQRYNHLVIMAHEKGCGKKREAIPDFFKKAKTNQDVKKEQR